MSSATLYIDSTKVFEEKNQLGKKVMRKGRQGKTKGKINLTFQNNY